MRILTPNYKYVFDLEPKLDSDISVVREMWSENVYQIEDKDFSENGIFVDIGANIGAVSLKVSSFNDEREDKIKIYAFEPNSDNRHWLSENVKTNNKIKEVKIVAKAISDKSGKVKISNEGGDSKIGDEGEEVECITLKGVFDYIGKDECDVLKMDIEGSEWAVFTQAKLRTLRRIKYLSLEFHATDNESFGRVITKLAKVFNLHIIGLPDRGGYIYGRRY
jgi:FkbM family methyltransferase